jgi:hypothetical protein
MSKSTDITVSSDQSRNRILMVGGLIGAVLGVFGAFLLIQGKERRGGEINVSPNEGIRLGLILFALLRNIYELPERK